MWVTITELKVFTGLSGAEMLPIKTAAVGAGQTESLTETIRNVVNECRGYIAACSQNTLGDGETVPEKLVDSCIAVIRYRLFARLPLVITAARIDAKNDALSLWRHVAACKFRIEEPTTPDDESLAGFTPSFEGRLPKFGQEFSDGL